MSALLHCDGPGCTETRDPNTIERAMYERGWIKVSEGEGVKPLDFHSRECLANWTAGQTGSTTTVVDGR